ncbi:DUF58 domain-containing protein [Sphingomonas sp. URHD0057]|uniref:DUF58 domain-containing protein n=1 Tax=Sphingomonas sp. URHD0057 TaxID=1380389 RepID=UPI0004911315|nr:DUF58 domain-containing protein [Sphingomonas sp. URHD0057]
MIYPTRLAVLATAGGAPLALALAAVAPGRWYLALAWPLAIALMCGLDALRGAGAAAAVVDLPGHAYVGEVRDCAVTVEVGSRPRAAWVSLDSSPLIGMEDDGRARVPLDAGRGAILLSLTMLRRGAARVEHLWLRWTGPLGLVWRQATVDLRAGFPVLPDLRPVHEQGARVFQRFALEGLLLQLSRGEGSDFDALVDFRQGMDRRTIDWKQSARHTKLLGKQYRTERNSQIVFAIDTGRQMCEPVAGLARVDRCVSAMLLTAWIALKLGDRVALNAFDSRPRLSSGFVSGGGAFGELQRLAADIDYSSDETNYTFALTSLASRLTRRSMIILFTEITDAISADFMVRALHRLVETHLVLVVVLRDEELETIASASPEKADDVTRAVTAAALLKDRRLVISRLRHLGVHVVESDYDKVSDQLVLSYIDLKKRDLL